MGTDLFIGGKHVGNRNMCVAGDFLCFFSLRRRTEEKTTRRKCSQSGGFLKGYLVRLRHTLDSQRYMV